MRQRLLRALAMVGVGVVTNGGAVAEPHSPAAAQQRRPTFSARAELVVLHVTVRDKAGRYVTGLTADRFTVLENGKRQEVQFFASEDAPVTIGLIVDSSGSMRTARDGVLAALDAFVATSNPQDQLFALAYNEHVRSALPADQPFTNDLVRIRSALAAAVSAVGRTALYDAVSAGLNYAMKGAFARKALVIVSDGGDNASRSTFEEVMKEAESLNTQIYTVALLDPLDHESNPKRLKQLATATGGEWFEPSDPSHVVAVLRDIARDIRNTYTIGYTPSYSGRQEQFRRIRVVVTTQDGRRTSVRTRQGYVLRYQ